jgi:predicted amidophosphoribosyltransferase
VFSKKKAMWIKQEHMWGQDTYMCSKCKAIYTQRSPVCPRCASEMKNKTGYDPVFIDEMQDYD